MIPSAPNPTGDHLSAWQTGDGWVNHTSAAAAPYHSSLAGSSGATAVAPASSASDPSSAGLGIHRHQILDWENAMLLATHHSSTPSSGPPSSSLYDHVASDYSKTAGMPLLQADSLSSFNQTRHYEDLLSAHINPSASSGNFASRDAWGLLNTVCSRPGGSGSLLQDTSLLQQSAAQFSGYESFHGAESLSTYGNLGTAAAAGLYVDSVRSGSTNGYMGLNSFDQRRLDDIMKRELYSTQADYSSSRLGLNLGGRTYFSADDFAFGRWGKRSRPNSPGCLMQPAPLCQAEGCKADLSMAKHYHRRHKVCEYHSKAATVHIGNQTQRFCQQCSRFHLLDEFDDGKRSCRKRLADHNRRRRKPQPTPVTSATTSTDAPAADTAIKASAEQDETKDGGASTASDHAGCKEPTSSQEAATGASDSCNDASGTMSEKASPTPTAEDEAGLSSTKSMQAACSSASQKEAAGGTTIKSAQEASPVAAGLSLGGAAAEKPANETMEEGVLGNREVGSVKNSKQAAAMPWLQASGKKKARSAAYEDPPAGGAAGCGRPASFKAMSAARLDAADATRGSWMNAKSTGAGLVHAGYVIGSKPAGGGSEAGGSQELLCLLSDEGELLNAQKQGGGSASGGGIATLGFLDQAFPSSDHQLPFITSDIRVSDQQERQASMALPQGPPPSTMAFGGLGHIL